jgi:hypothetical protein
VRILGVVSSSISRVASLIDTFTRTTAGSLGGTWSNIIGTWFANGTKAENNTVTSNIGLTAAVAGGENPLILADVTADNVGVAFWVTDSSNYWAASVNQAIVTTYTYSSSCSAYSSVGYGATYSCSSYAVCTSTSLRYGACLGYAAAYGTYCATYGGRYGTLCTSYASVTGSTVCMSSSVNYVGYSSVCNTYSSVLSNTTYSGGTRTFSIIKKVSGSVSTVYSAVITAAILSYRILSTSTGWLWVKAFPSAGQSGVETIDYLSQPSSPAKATKQGLYVDLSGYLQTKTADNVSISGSSVSNVHTGTASVSGGTLTSDDAYYYRTFTGNGSLTVTGSLTCDVLIGAGGGGGQGGSGGGSYTSGYIATTGSYAFVIGAAGNNSTGIGITAYAGGGSGANNTNGSSGGSGGAPGYRATCPGSNSGGAATRASGGTITYGEAGGSSSCNTYWTGQGGGGGWGSAGGDNYDANCPGTDCYGQGGSGGAGVSTYSNWGAAAGIGQLSGGLRYFGGGSGGTAGSGGTSGLGVGANTSGYGSSGFVMVRYLKSAVA